jgi:hypothetical protein
MPVVPLTITRNHASRSASNARVVELPIPADDASLVAALRSDRRDAPTALFKRYGDDVERVLYRIMGQDPELEGGSN